MSCHALTVDYIPLRGREVISEEGNETVLDREREAAGT